MNTGRDEKVVIQVDKVVKEYKSDEFGFFALKGIDLTVNQGEFMAIVGKSGSGKSTLLNLLGGIDRPTTGRVMVRGQEISSMNEKRLSRFRGENIGFVFQFFQLMPMLTVLENVVMPMDFLGKIPGSKRKERALILLSKVGISEHAHKFPSTLSGGEQQRVAIARALANDPQYILADEPTGNLDTKTAEDIFNLLKSLAKEGKNIIMVTHNPELAERCERIIRIQDGQVIEDIYTNNCRG